MIQTQEIPFEREQVDFERKTFSFVTQPDVALVIQKIKEPVDFVMVAERNGFWSTYALLAESTDDGVVQGLIVEDMTPEE